MADPLDDTDVLDRATAAGKAPAPPRPADQLMSQLGESNKRQEAILRQEEREKTPVINAAIRENNAPMPQAPKLERETEAPKSNIQQQMQEWMMPIVALSALAGAFSRQHATTALNAFAAGVQGLKQGNLELYDQKLKEWKAANERLIQNNEAAIHEYNAAWNNRKLNIDQKMNEIQLISAKYQDRLTYEAAAQKNFTLVAQMLQKQEDLTEKLKLQYDNLRLKSEQTEAKMIAIKKFMAENPDASAQDIQNFQAQGRPPRSAPAMALQKFMQEHPDATSQDIEKFAQDYAGSVREGAAVGQRAGSIAIAVDEAHKTIPNVRAAAQQSAGRGYATWNAVENKWNVEKGDANFAYYVQQINALVNLYGRVISGGGKGTVSDLEHARGMLNPNMPLSAVEGALKGFETEIDIAEKAPEDVRSKMRGGSTAAPPASGAESAGGAGGAGQAAPANVIRYDAQGNRVQ